MPGPAPASARRVLLHLDDGRRVPLDPAEIFLLEADGDETVVRTRGRRRLRDVRSLGDLLDRLPAGLFVLVHRAPSREASPATERIAKSWSTRAARSTTDGSCGP